MYSLEFKKVLKHYCNSKRVEDIKKLDKHINRSMLAGFHISITSLYTVQNTYKKFQLIILLLCIKAVYKNAILIESIRIINKITNFCSK